MFPGKSLDELWGGVVKEYRLDIAKRVLTMDIEVLDGGHSSLHGMQFSGVISLAFNGEWEESWDYIELTSIFVSSTEDGGRKVEMEFWVSDWTAEIYCESLEVNGQSV